MSWLKLDDAMGEHRKTRRLLRTPGGGLDAFGLHALALLHCARYLTDGFVEAQFVSETFDEAGVRGQKARASVVDSLVANGQWARVDGGWNVHDYLKHNPSRAAVEQRRARDAERKALGRTSSARSPNGVRADSARTPTAVRSESARPDPTRPIPSNNHIQLGSTQEVVGGAHVEPSVLRRVS